MNIQQHINKVKNKDIDIVETTKDVLKKIEDINKKHDCFLTISKDLALKQAKKLKEKPFGKLAGVFISVKDAICVKDIETAAGSEILKGYKPPFNATAVQRCIDQGAIIIGKTNQDEFGFGSFNVNVGINNPIPKNPNNTNHACGGSSGGSGCISKLANFPHISLGESTGGSIVSPASYCGVFGLCPTYGKVSRYGLLDYGNSLDKIGPMGKNVDDIALGLNIISGHDPKDSTSYKKKDEDYTKIENLNLKNLKIGVINRSFDDSVSKEVQEYLKKNIEKLRSKGVNIDTISLDFINRYSISSYYIIAMCEASTNLAKYSGLRYGKESESKENFNEYFKKIRSENFNQETKRRIMIGTFARTSGYRDAYYLKAMKVRTMIIDEYKKIFKKYDLILSPTMPTPTPKFDEIKDMTPLQHYMSDIFTGAPNLAGLPHINIPIKTNNLPIGLLFIADHFNEKLLLQIAKEFE